MPSKGDRALGEDLVNVTFKIQKSVMDVVDQHLRMLQRTTRWQRIGRNDALRDIFLRGIDSIEHPPAPSTRDETAAHALAALAAAGEPDLPPVPAPLPTAPYEARALPAALDLDLEPTMVSPVEPAATTAGGAIPPAPAYEARALTPDLAPEPDLPIEHPLDLELADPPLALAVDVTQESAVPAAQSEEVRPARSRRTARPKVHPPMPIKPKRARRAQRGD
jgi:hypothetical protein